MKIFVNSGLVQLKIGPLHLDYLAAILSSVQETMPKGDVEKERIAQDGNTDLKNYAEYSKDDLRTGLFDYIVRHGKCKLSFIFLSNSRPILIAVL